MKILENLKYTKNHEWVKIDGNEALIGISDFAQHELGDIVFVDVPTVGETLKQDETFGSIEAVKTVSDLFMPVGGEVIGVNGALEDKPELVNKDPYGEGWMIRIKLEDSAKLEDLLSADDYRKMIEA